MAVWLVGDILWLRSILVMGTLTALFLDLDSWWSSLLNHLRCCSSSGHLALLFCCGTKRRFRARVRYLKHGLRIVHVCKQTEWLPIKMKYCDQS
ncbi:hypothetical protein Hanom_Chr08g00700901 [Helianthus anomalus]